MDILSYNPGHDGAVAMPLADRLKAATRKLHTEAETTGFIGALLKGEASREGYALYLRNLLPVYEAMEKALEHHAGGPLACLGPPAVRRAPALLADLRALVGPEWEGSLSLLPSSRAYAQRIAAAAAADGGFGLIGHAYTRFLGDLNGGQVLRRLLARRMQLRPETLAFYEFPQIDDLARFAADYRARIDGLGACIPDTRLVVEEARASFSASIAISMEVAERAGVA